MLLKKCIAIFAAGLMLANCATAPEDDNGIPWGWIAAGVAAVVVVAVVVAASNAPDFGYKCPPEGCISDVRLKRDIERVDTLPNGLQLYSFRYWNDDRTFVSVMAQDLLVDERFRHAVIQDDSGYYKIDLAALGLGIEGDAEQFFEAGQKTVAEAAPVTN